MNTTLSTSNVKIYTPQFSQQKLEKLAERFNVEQTEHLPVGAAYFSYEEVGLALLFAKTSKSKIETLLHIDFINGKNGYRYAKDCTIKQAIARAVGIKSGFRPTIFDATAGLGGDGFVLACLGSVVTLCERSPILYSLLEDALERAAQDIRLSSIIENNMSLIHGNSYLRLNETSVSYHTIYMDPMYPHKQKSALNKKSMRVIRDFVGDDDDSSSLLEVALERAENRVVVKRPKGAPYVMDRKPSHEITMKNSRYDVYLV